MLAIVKEVVRELAALAAAYLGPRRHLQLAFGLGLVLAVGYLGMGLLSLLGDADPRGFSYPRVRGTVLYEDGSPIPVQGLSLHFIGEDAGKGASGAGRLGQAVVDEKSGAFDCVLRVLPAHGKHTVKVALALNSGGAATSDVVPPRYADPEATPLEISPRGGAVTLRVRKPAS